MCDYVCLHSLCMSNLFPSLCSHSHWKNKHTAIHIYIQLHTYDRILYLRRSDRSTDYDLIFQLHYIFYYYVVCLTLFSLFVSISLAIFHTPVCCAVLCTWYFQKFQSDNTIIINFWWMCVSVCVCTFLTHEEGECKCNKMWNRTGVKCEYVLRKTASRKTSWTLLVCSAV